MDDERPRAVVDSVAEIKIWKQTQQNKQLKIKPY